VVKNPSPIRSIAIPSCLAKKKKKRKEIGPLNFLILQFLNILISCLNLFSFVFNLILFLAVFFFYGIESVSILF
jgi:hypothetical protein